MVTSVGYVYEPILLVYGECADIARIHVQKEYIVAPGPTCAHHLVNQNLHDALAAAALCRSVLRPTKSSRGQGDARDGVSDELATRLSRSLLVKEEPR